MLIFISLKKITIINNAKARNDLELYQIALRILLNFMLLVHTYSIKCTLSALPRSLKGTRSV